MLYAEIDPRQSRGSRWMLNVAGHDARPDVFQLTIQREPRPLIRMKVGLSKQGEEASFLPQKT